MLLARAGLLLVLTISFFFTASCSLGDRKPEVRLNIEPKTFAAYLDSQRTTFDCYFVSIDGDGISPDFGPLNLGSRSPACLGLGMTSPLLSLDELTGDGTKLRVVAGPKRRVRILGVNTNAPKCAGEPLGTIFGTRRPAIFEVASAIEDIFVDKKVAVNGSLSTAGNVDIVPGCDNTGIDQGDSTSNLVVSGSTLVLSLANGDNHAIRTYNIGEDLKPVSPTTITEVMTMSNSELSVTPNGASLFLVGGGLLRVLLTRVQRFISDGKGGLLSGTDYQQQLGAFGLEYYFSADSKNAYSASTVNFFQRRVNATTLTDIGPPTPCDLPSLAGPVVTKSHVFIPRTDRVFYLPLPSNGDVCITAPVLAIQPFNSVTGNLTMLRAHQNGVLYAAYFNPGDAKTYLTAYLPQADGSWTAPHGSAFQLIAPPTALHLDRAGKFIVVRTPSDLAVYRLKKDGSLHGLGSSQGISPSARNVAIEALSKALYVVGPTTVSGYSIDEEGELDGLSLSLDPLPYVEFEGIAIVPQF